MWNIKALALTYKFYYQGQSIQNVGQTPRSRSQGKKCWYPQKGSDTKNAHMKYQSFSTHFSNVVKSFQKIGQIPRSSSHLLVPKWNNKVLDRIIQS